MGPPDGWCYEGKHTVRFLFSLFLISFSCVIIISLITRIYIVFNNRRTQNALDSAPTRRSTTISSSLATNSAVTVLRPHITPKPVAAAAT
jgi:heme/copper-type cytochrome/quinol oxidase subunit 2